MKMRFRYFVLGHLLWQSFAALPLAICQAPRTHAVMNALRVAINQLQSSEDRRLDFSVQDLKPYLDLGVVEQILGGELERSVVIYSGKQARTDLGDLKVFVLLKVPQDGGAFQAVGVRVRGNEDANHDWFSLDNLTVFNITRDQLQNAGFDLSFLEEAHSGEKGSREQTSGSSGSKQATFNDSAIERNSTYDILGVSHFSAVWIISGVIVFAVIATRILIRFRQKP